MPTARGAEPSAQCLGRSASAYAFGAIQHSCEFGLLTLKLVLRMSNTARARAKSLHSACRRARGPTWLCEDALLQLIEHAGVPSDPMFAGLRGWPENPLSNLNHLRLLRIAEQDGVTECRPRSPDRNIRTKGCTVQATQRVRNGRGLNLCPCRQRWLHAIGAWPRISRLASKAPSAGSWSRASNC